MVTRSTKYSSLYLSARAKLKAKILFYIGFWVEKGNKSLFYIGWIVWEDQEFKQIFQEEE